MTLEFLRTVAVWCSLSASGGYIDIIEACRKEALQCATPVSYQAVCLSNIRIRGK